MSYGLIAYRGWSTQEDATLLLMRAEGQPLAFIAKRLGRGKNSACGRWHRISKRARAA